MNQKQITINKKTFDEMVYSLDGVIGFLKEKKKGSKEHEKLYKKTKKVFKKALKYKIKQEPIEKRIFVELLLLKEKKDKFFKKLFMLFRRIKNIHFKN